MIEQILLVAGVTFLVMISPGPDMLVVMRNTLVSGPGAGLKTSAGVLAGNLIHISYSAIGIGLLISQSILAFTALKYAGAAYLIWLGVMSFRAKPEALETGGLKRAGRTWFAQGFLNNILNPKGALFYLGVFTAVITPGTSAAATLLLVVVMMSVSAAFWLVFVQALDRRIIRDLFARSHKTTARIFGGLLVFLGLRVAFLSR